MLVRIGFISDTHGKHRELELMDCDILVHSGDITVRGEKETVIDFNRWLYTVSAEHKIVIAGNHDWCLEKEYKENNNEYIHTLLNNCHYLCNSSVKVCGIKFWGSPFTPYFHGWAFNQYENELKRTWAKIPLDTDVLVTHGPAYKLLDLTYDDINVGCRHLLEKIKEIKPKIHAFGHLHEQGNKQLIVDDTMFINACNLDLTYKVINIKPIYIELEK